MKNKSYILLALTFVTVFSMILHIAVPIPAIIIFVLSIIALLGTIIKFISNKEDSSFIFVLFMWIFMVIMWGFITQREMKEKQKVKEKESIETVETIHIAKNTTSEENKI